MRSDLLRRSRIAAMRKPVRLVLIIAVVQLGFVLADSTSASASVAFSGPPSVRVVGNHLVDGSGNPIRLIGVDHSGSEYACVTGQGILNPPNADSPAMIAAMKSWNINTVRLPLNEDCWLGINGANPSGAPYQSAIVSYVNDLNAAGLAVILDLHRNAPGTELSNLGQPMADEDHAPAFWTSVASAFKGHQGVLFDLYNEPQYLAPTCLVNGGCTVKNKKTKIIFQVAGYNQLISDVRSTGATNVVMVGGTAFAANPTAFKKAMPTDPLNQLAISVHVYDFNAAKTAASWAKWVKLGLLNRVPFITGELGEKDCTSNFINTYMPWADANGVSYLAWTFNAGPSWLCTSPSLITDYTPTANPYGAGYEAHIAGL